MLSRVYSYDMLGSFIAIPVGQLAFGPLGATFGVQQMILVAGVAYCAIWPGDAHVPGPSGR